VHDPGDAPPEVTGPDEGTHKNTADEANAPPASKPSHTITAPITATERNIHRAPITDPLSPPHAPSSARRGNEHHNFQEPATPTGRDTSPDNEPYKRRQTQGASSDRGSLHHIANLRAHAAARIRRRGEKDREVEAANGAGRSDAPASPTIDRKVASIANCFRLDRHPTLGL